MSIVYCLVSYMLYILHIVHIVHEYDVCIAFGEDNAYIAYKVHTPNFVSFTKHIQNRGLAVRFRQPGSK